MDAQHLFPILEEMDHFEKELAKRGTPYFSGNLISFQRWKYSKK